MRLFLLTLIGLTPLIKAEAPAAIVSDPAHLIGTVSVFGSLLVLVFRLGVWRQEMINTRNNVGAEVKAYREQSNANFDRIERRLCILDRLIRRVDRLEQAREE